MTRKNVLSSISPLVAAFTMTAAFAIAGNHHTAPVEALRDVEASAREAAADAESLRTEVQNPLTGVAAESERLNRLKEELNRMGKAVTALEAQAGELPAWQQRAIAQIVPLLEDDASAARSAIASFNEHPNALWRPVNREYAERMAHDSREIVATVSHSLRTNE